MTKHDNQYRIKQRKRERGTWTKKGLGPTISGDIFDHNGSTYVDNVVEVVSTNACLTIREDYTNISACLAIRDDYTNVSACMPLETIIPMYVFAWPLETIKSPGAYPGI